MYATALTAEGLIVQAAVSTAPFAAPSASAEAQSAPAEAQRAPLVALTGASIAAPTTSTAVLTVELTSAASDLGQFAASVEAWKQRQTTVWKTPFDWTGTHSASFAQAGSALAGTFATDWQYNSARECLHD